MCVCARVCVCVCVLVRFGVILLSRLANYFELFADRKTNI